MSKDYLWLNLRDLPYFRSILRAVEAQYYQDLSLPGPTLDIGCGDGHFASIAFDRRLEVGLDPMLASIQEARRRNGYASLIQADGGHMPFPEAHFGSAISNSVLEHIPYIQDVLNETARVLRPGAPFIFCVPNPGYLAELSIPAALQRYGLPGLGSSYRQWFRRMSHVEHLEDANVWQGWLEQAGFCLEKWWNYFSPRSMRALEWGHYFGAPSLVSRKLFGRWILSPTRWNLSFTERLVRPYAETLPLEEGTFTFYIARRKM
jgi:SAM-dependent methyltransferase